MPRSSSKKSVPRPASKKASTGKAAITLPLNQKRTGMPALKSIIAVKPLATGTGANATASALSASLSRYRIIVTDEVDAYEKVPAAATALKAFLVKKAAAATGDSFKGTSRKAAKLSIAKAKVEVFGDVKDLIKSLTPDKNMKQHVPKITTDAKSDRVAEENRNIRVRAFLYAASREDDNDFHLIIGRDPKSKPEMYMTMELSGLPPASSPSFKKLKATRDAFKKFFKDNLPGTGYEFPDPPIPVEIEGSLFFDMSHASGSKPGPKTLKNNMPTIWEVHPITKMVFEP